MYRYIFLLFAILLSLPLFVSALELNLTYPKFPGGPDINDPSQQGLAEIILWFYFFFVGISGFVAFIMLVWGGFQYLISAGNPSQIGDARDRIFKALLGLLFVLTSFIIIQFINPELTTVGSQNLNIVLGPGFSNILQGTVQGQMPAGETREGIYLCLQDGCRCRTPSNCVGSENVNDGPGGGFDYLRIDPASLIAQGGKTNLANWSDKATAIAKKGDFDVLLFEKPNSGGKAVCFNTHVGRLDDFEITSNDGWAGNPASLRLLDRSSEECYIPGITLLNETHFDGKPVVFLFDKKEYGQRPGNNARVFAEPCNYFFRDSRSKAGNTNQGASCDVYSVWIAGANKCGSSKAEQCAVRFYEGNNVNYKLGDGNDEQNDRLCFKSLVPDIRRSQYSFDNANPTNDIRDDIDRIRVLPDSDLVPPDCPIDQDGIVMAPPKLGGTTAAPALSVILTHSISLSTVTMTWITQNVTVCASNPFGSDTLPGWGLVTTGAAGGSATLFSIPSGTYTATILCGNGSTVSDTQTIVVP